MDNGWFILLRVVVYIYLASKIPAGNRHLIAVGTLVLSFLFLDGALLLIGGIATVANGD